MVNKIVADQPNGLTVSTSNETWILEKGFTISDDDIEALFESSLSIGNTFTIKGSVENLMGETAADFNGADTTVNITEDGLVDGGYAGATFDGNGASVVNDGKVVGGSVGMVFNAKGFDLVNNASIEAGGRSLEIEKAGGKIVNGEDGVMSGDISAMLIDNYNYQRVTIVNQGEMHGGNFSIFSTTGKEHIRNTGLLDGNISLGGGADVLDSRGGGIVGNIDLGAGDDRIDLRQRTMVPADPADEGLVLGGGGDDTFIIDDAAIKIVEAKNGGNDTVKSTVSVKLGDYVETLQLIGKDDANGAGNSGFNILKGNAGDNHLKGKAGFDDLNGGRGNDILTGGADGDVFMFATHGGHDRITDFDSVSDVVDLSAFDIGSFSELKKQHMQDVGDNLVISFGDDVLTLKDTHIADIVKADFML
jgi:Ca2+-binding RTX toxin-like protein